MKVFVLACLVALAAAAPAVEDLEWESWKQEHGKQYEDDVTELHRYSVWKSNLDFINIHNQDTDKSFTVGMNAFGDLTTEEIVETMNGYKMRATNSSLPTFKGSPSLVIEETVDWRDKGYVTPVKNQGQCGSCWAFSTTGSLEGQHFKATQDLVSLSEQNLMDCSKLEGNNGCKGGLMDHAFKYIEKKGIDTEMSYPYQAHDEMCRFRESDVGATMTSYRDVERGDVQALTQAIGSIGPISVAMDAHLQSFHFYKQGVYSDNKCSSTKLDHGVLAVGYGTYEGQDYFLVKNSWGTVWGQEGYFMIKRGMSNMCGLASQASYPIV